MLFVALGGYGLICIVHYYLENYVEKQAFFWCKSNKVSKVAILTKLNLDIQRLFRHQISFRTSSDYLQLESDCCQECYWRNKEI